MGWEKEGKFTYLKKKLESILTDVCMEGIHCVIVVFFISYISITSNKFIIVLLTNP